MKNLFTFLIAATMLSGCKKCYECSATEQRRVQGESPEQPLLSTYELCDITAAQLRYHVAANSGTTTTEQGGQTVFVEKRINCTE
jgi:hypothetical protein